jgi:hypothetical protein
MNLPMNPTDTPDLLARLERIADALERLAPPAPRPVEPDSAEAFVWHPQGELAPVAAVNRIDIGLLKGIDRLRDSWWRTPSASPRACRPTMRCCGAPAAWARARWSRPSMPWSTARTAAGSSWSRSTARTSRHCRG